MRATAVDRRSWIAGSGLGAAGWWVSGALATASGASPLWSQQQASGALGGTLEQRLAPPTAKVQAVLDTDTYNEIDDQFAVAYALLSPQHMEIEAVYAAPFQNERSKSAGEGMQKSYEEILRILGRLSRKTEGYAYLGSERFMAAPRQPVESDAARNLIAKAMQPRTSPLYVLTIGAPTNVSSALLMEPAIRDRIVVVWLGGQPLSFPTAREFNLQQDLHSSRVLLDSGVALVVIPTRNVSEHLRTTVPEVQHHLKGKSPIADYLATEYEAYTQWKSPHAGYPLSRVIWDISAIAWLIEPKWVPTEVVPSPGLSDQYTWERPTGRHPVRFATYCSRDAIFNDLFRKLQRGS
ncbi:MAG: nucleoside hydrolase [Bryobacterales bacterium]|jgi:inosine-uridine nucleoside N-ribohydrolase|nr:nucleoside hydrolase [Bryobacterales bacterium]